MGILTLMSAIVWFGFAQIIVEFAMLNVLREKKMYFFMKHEITADMNLLMAKQRTENLGKKQLYITAAKAQANPQMKEQDLRASKLQERMEKQFEGELAHHMKEIKKQLTSLRRMNEEIVPVQDQTLLAVVKAFEWGEQTDD